MPVMVNDTYKEVALKRMKRIATGLFFLMVVIFFAAKMGEQTYSWLGFIRAFAEAAMIGALADWFAVTALFSHPLGIPLPHTNIIPSNQERIADNLGNFIKNNFLKPEVLEEKLRSKDIIGDFANWLMNRKNTAVVADETCFIIKEVINAVDDNDIKNFIRQNITSAIRSIEIAPLIGKIMTILTSNNKHIILLDRLIDSIRKLVDRYEIDQSGWFKWLLSIIKKIKLTFLLNIFDHIHKSDTIREIIEKEIQDFIEKLHTSVDFRIKMEKLKEEILQDKGIQEYLDNIWNVLKFRILNDLDNPESNIRENIQEAIITVSKGLIRDKTVRQKINDRIKNVAITLLSKYSDDISYYIAETVKKWKPVQIRNIVELEIGKDLQYIRINGTIIGGFVGLLIHTITLLIS